MLHSTPMFSIALLPRTGAIALFSLLVLMVSSTPVFAQAGDAALGTRSYDDYETPGVCGECHIDIYRQWEQTMMSQSFTHKWDEVEYFKLALPHALKDEKVAGVKAGCNGCHAPLAFLAGDIPPSRPAENTRANEGVSCEICHTVAGFEGDIPHNFNWITQPGDVKFGPRAEVDPGAHEGQLSDFLGTAEFCGTCHNEMSPYNVWVKSTHLEWKEGPYSKEGVKCQDCHMTYAHGTTVDDGTVYPDARQHIFHGAHNQDKIKGTIELSIHPDVREVKPGETVKMTVALFNQKAGHEFPSGSVEDRIVWLDVVATDAAGRTYHLKVDPKGFEGEEYTIATEALAYQDMSIALDDPNFAGVQRDGVPVGDRIFRMAYFDPQGRMTIQQWNTASLGTDYRLGPRETKLETFTWELPADIATGPMNITATLNYSKLVKPVAEFLGVADEAETVPVNEHTTALTVL